MKQPAGRARLRTARPVASPTRSCPLRCALVCMRATAMP